MEPMELYSVSLDGSISDFGGREIDGNAGRGLMLKPAVEPGARVSTIKIIEAAKSEAYP